jgi:DMSO/TMAO reductase YedYZ molybdopterin-dependent catalytic subunit
MSDTFDRFLADHQQMTRRWLLQAGATGMAVLGAGQLWGDEPSRDSVLRDAIGDLEPFLTLQDHFQDVSRGKPKPHSLPEKTKGEVGLTRDTWSLEVVSDPDNPARLRQELTAEEGTAFGFRDLMQLAESRAVRFAKVMTCLNIGCPLGTGIWEGVPLREVIWATQPRENLRRVFYYGYHNDDPEQMFRSSLPVGRVFEDPFDLPPVILCYKLNGQWLSPERGGPVRVVVPEAYGFKSIKWLSHVVLSNIAHANDTYAEKNNDVDSPLKTFAATLTVPQEVSPGAPFAVTGYAQVGISGLSKVQVWIHKEGDEMPPSGQYYADAPWIDAEILPPPQQWGGGLPNGTVPTPAHGFDSETGEPTTWPLRLAKVHWAALIPGLSAGNYTLRSRTVDEKGHAQPMPRPFRKSGHSAIEQVSFQVTR